MNKKFEVISVERVVLFLITLSGYASILYLVGTNQFFLLGIGFLIALIISQFGILLMFHRVVCHRAAEFSPWLKNILIFLGGLCYQGSVVAWASIHRQHHVHQDTERDPHSPKYYGVLYTQFIGYSFNKIDPKFTISFLKQKDLKFWHDNYFKIYIPVLILPFIFLPAEIAMSIILVPVGFSFLLLSLINTMGHSWSKGIPQNSKFLGLFVWGDMYHKNHHDNPTKMKLGKWDFIGHLGELLNTRS